MTPEFIADNFHLIGTDSGPTFETCAESAVRFQRQENPVYGRFEGFHYLPIEAFKRSVVASFPHGNAEAVFVSSGTGMAPQDSSQKGSSPQGLTPLESASEAQTAASERSRHYVRSLDVYRRSVICHFERVFGPGPFRILAHLPSYEELGDSSSLVCMVNFLIESFGTADSTFFLDDSPRCRASSDKPVLLFGAAFGLLSLAEPGNFHLPRNAVVIETGGMKTHRKEIRRSELHDALANGFGVERSQVTSEYGMCELLSQCYLAQDGLFYPPPWMQFEVMDPSQPGEPLTDGQCGALAVFDLANIYSVCAILTEDRAVKRGKGFELLGRLSAAELRGCNFLMEDRIGTR